MNNPDINTTSMKEWKLYWHAREVIKGRWPEAEPTLAEDPIWAYYYAKHIIKGRWPEAEPVIINIAEWAYNYVSFALEQNCYWIDVHE